MTRSLVNVDVRNGVDGEQVKLVAVVLVDPATGQPIAGGGAPGHTIDFELLLIQDANAVTGVRREVRVDDVTTVQYETLDGSPWVPVAPVTLVAPSLPVGAANATNQSATNSALGTQVDVPAANDSATGSIIAFLKRLSTVLSLISSKLPASLGAKTAATSLSTTPATDANLARETYTTVTIATVTTDATGTAFVIFGSLICSSLDIINTTGTDIEVRRGASGNTLIIKDGQTRRMRGITNANAIHVRRKDVAVTPVILTAEAYTV